MENTLQVRFKRLRYDHPMPKYATPQSAGFDLVAHINNPELPVPKELTLYPGERVLIPAGFAVALPEGFELQVRPRSGLALKQGVSVVNSPGTVDSDYRGEVGVLVINHGQEAVVVKDGDRIAQAVIAPVWQAQFEVVEELDNTIRGEGGFGHTGV